MLSPLPRLGVLLALPVAFLGSVLHAADSSTMAVSAVVPLKNKCKFSAGALTLNFGNIDPASTSNATATATKNFACNGNAALGAFWITAGDGSHAVGVGARRMQHTAFPAEFLPYSLTVSPAFGTAAKGVDQTITIAGTILPSEFQNARAGAYLDSVVITLTP